MQPNSILGGKVVRVLVRYEVDLCAFGQGNRHVEEEVASVNSGGKAAHPRSIAVRWARRKEEPAPALSVNPPLAPVQADVTIYRSTS